MCKVGYFTKNGIKDREITNVDPKQITSQWMPNVEILLILRTYVYVVQ